MKYPKNRHQGVNYYNIARIEAALNKKHEALESLQKAVDAGIVFDGRKFKSDGFLQSLFGYPLFEELVKPKG